MPTNPDSEGVQTIPSAHAFPETVSRLTAALRSHGIKIFAVMDQQAEAAAAGLSIPPTTLILFGNPKAGTPLMVAQPLSTLDLPLKVAIWESPEGAVSISFNTASYIIARHHLPPALAANIAPVEKLLAAALL